MNKNELMRWSQSQEQSAQFSRENLTRVPNASGEELPAFWKSSSVNKLLTFQFPKELGLDSSLNPNHTVVLGGMCLLTTIDMKRMSKKEQTFSSIYEFQQWFSSWYPRIDQVHDTVGIPPNICKKAIYVSEDSFFADRIASYTGLPKEEVRVILQNTHKEQGHPVVEQYLKSQGYKGEVSVIYTSEIESELNVALNIWERMLGSKFRTSDRNFAKVELMYTGLWLDILNLQSSAVIFEAASKMILKGWLKIDEWFKTQQYGTGMNKNLGIAGYLPFLTTKGDSSLLSFDQVPNRGNYKTFEIPDDDMPWYITNLLFPKRAVTENGPEAIKDEDARRMIKSDLQQYFEG